MMVATFHTNSFLTIISGELMFGQSRRVQTWIHSAAVRVQTIANAKMGYTVGTGRSSERASIEQNKPRHRF